MSKKILTKQQSKDIILEKFGVDMFNLPYGLELPKEFAPYLDEETKEAWLMGWRGNIILKPSTDLRIDPIKEAILVGKPVFNCTIEKEGMKHIKMTLQEKLDYLATDN